MNLALRLEPATASPPPLQFIVACDCGTWRFTHHPQSWPVHTAFGAATVDVTIEKFVREQRGSLAFWREVKLCPKQRGSRFDLDVACFGGQFPYHRVVFWAFHTTGTRSLDNFLCWVSDMQRRNMDIDHRHRRWMSLVDPHCCQSA